VGNGLDRRAIVVSLKDRTQNRLMEPGRMRARFVAERRTAPDWVAREATAWARAAWGIGARRMRAAVRVRVVWDPYSGKIVRREVTRTAGIIRRKAALQGAKGRSVRRFHQGDNRMTAIPATSMLDRLDAMPHFLAAVERQR
jgi:hypothetical protein